MTITHGNHRLTLQNDGGHFRALVWTTEDDSGWRCRALITCAEFQGTSDRERWVSELHSFDPATGSAIIKTGEMEVTPNKAGPGGFRRCVYSWREWELVANREIRIFRTCEEPHEAYKSQTQPIVTDQKRMVVIDCRDENWDGVLYRHLYNRRPIELRNLHSSYENYMRQLAEMHCMEFFERFTENRGEFKPRER